MHVKPFPVAMRNGSLIPVEEASIPVVASSLYGALGVYETVEIVQRRAFRLQEHLARLDDSARMSGFTLPVPTAHVAEWIPSLLEANHVSECLLRVVIVDMGEDAVTYFLYLMHPPNYPRKWYETGVPVTTYAAARSLPLIKSLNTLVPGLARRKAMSLGAHDALLIDSAGNVTEGSNCNVCAVIKGTLLAPPYGTVLEGITMSIVLDLARDLGIPVERRPLPAHEIPLWEEAFLTSTRRHVLPIARVDDHEMAVGPITRALMGAYDELFRRELGI